MWKRLKEKLKWLVAGSEMEELHRWRAEVETYQRWLAEFDDICLALENLKAEVHGQSLNGTWPPSEQGPWGVSGLREILRIHRGTSVLSKDKVSS